MAQISIAGDTSGSITLQAPAVAGTNTLTLPAVTGTVNLNGPAVYAYLSANQTGVSAATFTKITFNTIASPGFDTNSNFNTSTNRFTPTMAGYYLVTVQVQTGSGSPTQQVCAVYKNGSAYMYGNNVVATAPQVLNVTALVYCNGSTDYLEGWGYQSTAGSFLSGSSASMFQAVMVRGA